MSNTPLVIERLLDAPVDRVWSALTDRDEMAKWYFDMPDFKPVVGTEFDYTAGKNDIQYKHLFKVTRVEPNKVIAYTWRYDGYEGDSEVTFELFAEGDKTRLKLTHAGLETFPAIADFAAANFAEGWTMIVGQMLPEYLDKQ